MERTGGRLQSVGDPGGGVVSATMGRSVDTVERSGEMMGPVESSSGSAQSLEEPGRVVVAVGSGGRVQSSTGG